MTRLQREKLEAILEEETSFKTDLKMLTFASNDNEEEVQTYLMVLQDK